MKIGVIIVHFGKIDLTNRAINSIDEKWSDYIKIYITDNSLNYSLESNEPLFNFEILQPTKNLRYGGGVNLGLQKAILDGFEYFLIMNNDVELGPNFLDEISKQLNNGSSLSLIAPKIYYSSDNDKLWFNGGYFKRL